MCTLIQKKNVEDSVIEDATAIKTKKEAEHERAEIKKKW